MQRRYGYSAAGLILIAAILFIANRPEAGEPASITDHTGARRTAEECLLRDWKRPSLYCERHFFQGRPGTDAPDSKVVCGCFDRQTLDHWRAASDANGAVVAEPTMFLPEPYDESRPIPLWEEQ